ncbi:N-formylglutamate deformylase [uncultured Massilia sp.]|uniref:N-formylglutamate deformylase n=1 Tax=uncultured Massilia sp. TaxID=169973 RepID=UPI0025FD9356|nr:N-formylglutamate deformylase [uncultured Massilia sp.]
MDYTFKAGSVPLLLSMPHAGTDIPDEIAARMAPCALARADTDWHLPALYAFAEEMGASTLAARWSRYAIDLNRPPEDTNLYPGQDTTGLCPVDTFGRERLYREGMEPDADEVARRLQRYWRPYHAQLGAELERLLALHGRVVLWDAHSIASRVPRFFEGRLPDLNFGTADGRSCSLQLEGAMIQAANAQDRFSFVFNGRFKGGHITRFYGDPARGVHAIQLEMCQCLYMDETPPFAWRPDVAAEVQPLLRRLLGTALEWVRA